MADVSSPAASRPAWVLGSRGLLGAAVVRRLRGQGRSVRVTRVPWEDAHASVETLLGAAREFALEAPDGGEVFWCAGAGVIGTSVADLDQEVDVISRFLDRWRPPAGTSLFLASSAGGLYAGASGPPFDEFTTPTPLAPYGHAKLAAEELARAFSRRTSVPLLIGRISNLYGPGQDIAKPQGLISQLCRAQLTRQPLSIYVSLDTMRDYLFVEDAAAMVVHGLAEVSRAGGEHCKVLASESSTTIGAILGALHRISRRRPQVVLGASPNARFQVRDLRMRSSAWPATDHLARTHLLAGISATMASVGDQLRSAAGRR